MNNISKRDNCHSVVTKITSIDFFYKFVFCMSLAFMVYINVANAKHPILEEHAFRQTQTALTSYYLKSEGFRLDYETPVLGEPWSIPFEFPIYQQIVATTSAITGASLTETGRLISLAFTLLTCVPLYFSLAKLQFDSRAIYFSLALYMTSPLYLFWAGTFMIESSALFFTLSFAYYAIKLIKSERENRNIILFSFFLALALLQKVTTALPVLLVLFTVIVFCSAQAGDFNKSRPYLIKLAVSFLLPVIIAYLWIRFIDVVKLENPIAAFLTSPMLEQWTYGSLESKLSKKLWHDVIYDRNVKTTSFYFCGLIVVFMALFLVQEKPKKAVIFVSLLLFLIPFLMFSNLHVVHNYYQTANSVFLSVSVGVSVVYICNRFLKNNWAICALVLLSFISSNIYWFCDSYFSKKTVPIGSDNRTLILSEYIKNHTKKESPVIWYGFDWSSEAAFYSERKSLTVPDLAAWKKSLAVPEWYKNAYVIEKTYLFLKDKPSAIVLCLPTPTRLPVKDAINKKYGPIDYKEVAGCEVYLLDS